jgi:hypothetical protein
MINADKIKFSRHAKRQIKWRKISEKEVQDTVKNPDLLEASIKDRKNAFKLIEGRMLKITYKVENDDIIIITAMVRGDRT